MHDLSDPLPNVWQAGGPGWIPFNMCQPYCSHIDMTHCSLAFVVLSRLFLGMVVSPTVGDISPMRAFQSPQTTEFVFCTPAHPQ